MPLSQCAYFSCHMIADADHSTPRFCNQRQVFFALERKNNYSIKLCELGFQTGNSFIELPAQSRVSSCNGLIKSL